MAEYLRVSFFITKDELPRRTQRIPFAQLALGRFRPFFKDAGRSYRRQVGSRQPPDRPAGGLGRAFPSIRLPIVVWFPGPFAADRFNPGHNERFLPFNSLQRKDSSEWRYGLTRTGHSSKEAGDSPAPAHVSAECELLETLHMMISIRQAHNTLKRATCRTGEK